MERLIGIARERGVKRLVGQILAENGPMLRLMERLGFHVEPTQDFTVVHATLDLS